MDFNVLATGSSGNCVIINKSIAIDIGVPFKALEAVKKDLKLVLLTHAHGDHFNPRTVRALAKERPSLRWGCCEWIVEPLLEAGVDKRRIDVLEPGQEIVYPDICYLKSERLTHNVPNCGYHITVMGGERLFYATDTGTLDGIDAKGYDLYMIEANHTRAELEARMEAKRAAGKFSYELSAAANHLSREQAEDWLYQQIGPTSQYVFLHQHQEKEG